MQRVRVALANWKQLCFKWLKGIISEAIISFIELECITSEQLYCFSELECITREVIISFIGLKGRRSLRWQHVKAKWRVFKITEKICERFGHAATTSVFRVSVGGFCVLLHTVCPKHAPLLHLNHTNAENPHHYCISVICTSKQLTQHTQNPHHYCISDHANPTHHSHAKPETRTTTARQPKPLPHRQQRHTTCRKPPICKPSG